MIEYQFTTKHWAVFIVLIIAFIFASIQPLEYTSYMLHQMGTAIMLTALIICFKKVGLNFISFTLYIGFLFIHILGAHYLYSFVPYSDWSSQYLNFHLDHEMGWSRNMYDRWVHFAYGLLLYPFFLRLFQIGLPELSNKVIFLLVIQLIMVTSLIYEWIEWLLAISLSPDEAEKYNGQQGDIWDAHQDILFATIGALITGFIILMKQQKEKNTSSI